MPVFVDDEGPRKPKLDEWGHLHSRVFPDKSVAGVLENQGTVKHAEHNGEMVECLGRLNYARDGNPANGYDRLWWYRTVDDAKAAMDSWDYPKPPAGFIRDLHREPISSLEEE
jgi:hypothetical protein